MGISHIALAVKDLEATHRLRLADEHAALAHLPVPAPHAPAIIYFERAWPVEDDAFGEGVVVLLGALDLL